MVGADSHQQPLCNKVVCERKMDYDNHSHKDMRRDTKSSNKRHPFIVRKREGGKSVGCVM